jgi:hypothetical protein
MRCPVFVLSRFHDFGGRVMASDAAGGWGFLIFVAVAVIGIAWLVDAQWLNRWRYSPNGYRSDQIAMEHRPHDCDFWGAPIGRKDCHYKAVVTPSGSTMVLGVSKPTHVDITWEKVQD